MRRKIGLIFGVVVVGVLIWYLFLKPHDYIVSFKTKASPGTINQTMKFWMGQQENAELLVQRNLSDFSHRIQFNDSTFNYNWKVTPLNDSISKVKVYVSDIDHSLGNRIALPFSETNFEKRTKKTLKDALAMLQEHIQTFKVTVTGAADIPSKYCACIPLKNKQLDKVTGMMDYYSTLSNFIAENSIELDGRPLLEVENWNVQNDSIAYNFCFPIIKTDSLPQLENLIYKKLKIKKGLRAVYNGNYITSDRAWYRLLEYAKENDISIEERPLEIFHTDPNMGGNELEWKAEIFMPLKEK